MAANTDRAEINEMGAVATVKHASFEGVRTGRRISVVVRKGGNEQLSRERLVVSRATALLTMFNRGTVILPAHKRLLIEPRISIADRIVRKLHQRISEIESGTHQTSSTCKLAVRIVKKVPFWPMELLTLSCTKTNPT